MPIDVSLIRASKDGGVPEEVKKWQLARLPGDLTASVCTNAIQAEEFILRVQELENSRRLLLKEQSDKRSLLKRLQKQLAPRVGDDDSKVQKHVDEIRNEIKVLKCEVLPFVEKELEDKIKSLRKKFVKLANFVDTTPLSGTANKFYRLDSSNKNESLNSTLGSRGYRDIFADVLLSIGGCIPAGTLNISDGKKSDSITREKVVLSGIGSVISSGINSYAKEFFSDFEIIHLPRIISLPIPMVHDILGCKRGCIERTSQPICKICEAKDKGTVDVPSFIGLAVMNKDKTFHERMLPQKMLCPTRSEEGHSRFLHDVEEILLTAFSVSNINISRSLQDEIAQKIKLFCISLLVLSDTNSSKKLGSRVSFLSTTSGKQIIQLRVLEPSKLEMNECRRICIEGYLPSKNTYVELARVSNCASFVSRSLKIKCGGSNNKAQGIEFVHLVHGKICQELLMSWMLENNVAQVGVADVQAGNFSNIGVLVPTGIVPFCGKDSLRAGSAILLPFVRKLIRGKGGKLLLEDIVPDLRQTYFGINGRQKLIQRQSNLENLKRGDGPRSLNESICNPWDFLPLY